jgi:hypothetical protein
MNTRKRSSTLPIGAISEGTLRPEDLIPAFLYELERLRLTKAERATVREVNALVNDQGYDGTLGLMEMCEDLTTILENHVPDYCYFGTLEGDGACFGVWPDMDSLENDEIVKVDDLVLLDSATEMLRYAQVVSDHGNLSLYRRAGNRWIEVWSVV